MYKIRLKGSRKAVYLVWSNILGYGLADICEINGDEETFTMICSISTKYDAIPNQDAYSQIWDGSVVDLKSYDINTAVKGEYAGEFTDNAMAVLSGMFGVDIAVFGIPEDKWWIDAEMDPQYPYNEYENGKETVNSTLHSDEEALELDFVTAEDLGHEEWDEESEEEYSEEWEGEEKDNE